MSDPRPPGLATARAAPAVAQPSGSGAVAQLAGALHFGAMRTAEDRAVLLHAVAHDVGAAARACRRHPLDRAFEAVEGVGHAVHDHLKRLVIVIAAGFASGHGRLADRVHLIGNPANNARVPPGKSSGPKGPRSFAPLGAARVPGLIAPRRCTRNLGRRSPVRIPLHGTRVTPSASSSNRIG